VVPILAKNDVEERIISKSLEFIDEVIAWLATLETGFQGKVTDKTANIKRMQGDM
jgi:hypothetical protein